VGLGVHRGGIQPRQITGHKTASIYRRYRIVNEEDIRAAVERASVQPVVASNVVPIRAAGTANANCHNERHKHEGAG
jgi:hypothetical protein